jgi:predicted TIM-barrel fold metal-dependent hydrolase
MRHYASVPGRYRPGLLVLAFALPLGAASCGGGPAARGVEAGGQRIAVVDMHLHTGTWETMTPRFQRRVAQNVPNGLKWIMPWVATRQLSGAALIGELDKGGITAGGVFALYSPHTTGVASNEFVAEQIARDPGRLYGFASLRVDQWNLDAEAQLHALEAALQRPQFIGVKLAHAHQQIRLDDERFWPIYELAGRLHKPVYLHTGTSPNPGTRTEPPYVDPAYLEEAIRRYPQTIFILGHSGYDSDQKALTYTDSALAVAARHPNAYLETGALGADRAADVVRDYVRRVRKAGLVGKTLYGSDGPQRPGYARSHLVRFVAAMEAEGYTPADMQAVLAGNFAQVFGLPPFTP